ncbi:DUF2357 domain-containing protein [Klebsiella variicola]|uniref:DUF2357 domain-containing protein n=1 Tax=Klebsiella variicola TaxID=244366 RepID=UPI000E2AD54E|nr:DUF2357 domain-containing protein [Klebsiella variicola]SXF79216.1 Domain of uncharacterised function (DUF2357) [Klebsiella variicola]
MLEFVILNGNRKGSTFVLHSRDFSQGSVPFLLEDESVILKFKSATEYSIVTLYLHENEVEFTQCEYDSVNNEWIYTWMPKRIGGNFYESFFHNFFGIAELSIYTSNNNENKYFDLERLDVLAKKINADRVEKMLSFLSRHNNDALCAFFRVTRRNAGYKDGDTPADMFLEWIEYNANSLVKLIDEVIFEPVTKLVSAYKLVSPSLSSNIDDRTLGWLCDNAEELFETEDDASAIIKLNGSYYSSTKIRENVLVNDTDLYENQVIHGFIHTLKISVSALLAGYDTDIPYKEMKPVSNGYVSFYSQIKKFQRKINEKKIIKCNDILLLLNALQNKLHKFIPVKRKITGIPSLTMKAKYNRAYFAIFNKIISWYRFGSPDWSKQDELLSIKSIPKLFEYYCLFYLKELLDKKLNMQPSLVAETNAMDFTYHLHGFHLSLQYEPKYWMSLNKNADSADMVNTEAWTLHNDTLNVRGHHNIFSHRSPDFVIKIKNDSYVYHYILDAKYTTPKKAFSYYLPELTLKYIHGLHLRNGDSSLLGLTLIAPYEQPQVNHYHGQAFNILSSKPVVPALNIALVNPGEEFGENVTFEAVVDRVVDLLLSRIYTDIDRVDLFKRA